MIYISTISFLFILLSFANFLTFKFSIKNNQSYFIACCLIILISYLSFLIDKKYSFNTINYIFYFLFLISIYFFFLIDNFSKIQKSINIEFIFLFLIVFYFSKDRYYLDQDEFSYWGLSLKELLLDLQPYNSFSHHPKGTSLFQYLLVFFNYKEGLAIFANNILLISAYFYLFFERKLSIFEKIFLFLIYYLLLNNLSFGFVSIYSDPVLAIFFSCLLKLIYFFILKKDNKTNLNFFISFFLIFLTFLLINRSSAIYVLFISFIIFIFFSSKIKNKYLIILSSFFLIILLSSIKDFFLQNLFLFGNYSVNIVNSNVLNFLEYQFFSKNFYELFTSPIYFSHFGAVVSGILTFFSINNIFPQFQIPLFVYILLLTLVLFFKFKYKFFLFSCSFFCIFTYSAIVFILKFQIEKLSILALQRYIGIFLLANYFFYISIINKNFEDGRNKYTLIFFFFFLILVTPKKTLGFFAPDHIYYSISNNKNFKTNRENIKRLNEKKNIDNVILIHKDKMSDYSNSVISSQHTFYYNIILYELYPQQIKVIELEEFINIIEFYKNIKEDNYLFIFFDLSKDDANKVNFFKNFFIINTY